MDPWTKPEDLNRPGHIFPLRYRPGGVLKRAGHTEAAVDLARLAGMAPAGMLCEVVSADKAHMARLDELEALAERHGMLLISIADLVRYRSHTERLVRRIAGPVRIPSEWGDFAGYATNRCSTASSISRSWPGRSPTGRTSWCGCTRSA